jgi:hypothetical protein
LEQRKTMLIARRTHPRRKALPPKDLKIGVGHEADLIVSMSRGP